MDVKGVDTDRVTARMSKLDQANENNKQLAELAQSRLRNEARSRYRKIESGLRGTRRGE